MSLIIYTDPHIGLNRTNNTTPLSRVALRTRVYEQVRRVLKLADPVEDHTLCLGDLFDSYSNKEDIISDGEEILHYTNMLLAGNHDVTADADKMGSLEFLKNKHNSTVVYAPFGDSYASLVKLGDINVVAVPHVTTQALFEESLSSAIELGDGVDNSEPLILALHCNYNSPHELTETSLNLTTEHVTELLEVFDYVFVGHEHQPRILFNGRLIILGNTHPTGFSDISDKHIARVDVVNGKALVRFEQIWRMDEGYLEINVNKDRLADTATTAQFVRITGEVTSDKLATVAKGVSSLWKHGPNLLAVKSEVKVTGTEVVTEDGAEITAQSLPAIIAKELESDPPMKAMWEEFTN